jgi:hypothetical protein
VITARVEVPSLTRLAEIYLAAIRFISTISVVAKWTDDPRSKRLQRAKSSIKPNRDKLSRLLRSHCPASQKPSLKTQQKQSEGRVTKLALSAERGVEQIAIGFKKLGRWSGNSDESNHSIHEGMDRLAVGIVWIGNSLTLRDRNALQKPLLQLNSWENSSIAGHFGADPNSVPAELQKRIPSKREFERALVAADSILVSDQPVPIVGRFRQTKFIKALETKRVRASVAYFLIDQLIQKGVLWVGDSFENATFFISLAGEQRETSSCPDRHLFVSRAGWQAFMATRKGRSKNYKRDLREAVAGETAIAPEHRTRPLSLSKAAILLGFTGGKTGSNRVRRAINDRTLVAEPIGRQSYVFDIRKFPSDAHSKVSANPAASK